MIRIGIVFALALCLVPFVSAQPGDTPTTPGYIIDRITICTDVVDHEPVGVDSVFTDVETLYCFTEVTGAMTPTSITHVWYRGDEEAARVTLPVGAVRWRTYSSKRILPAWTGPWRVEVLDDTGAFMREIAFTIQ